MGNTVILTNARLATETTLSYTPGNNTAVCRFTIAVDRPRRDGKDQGADFIRIVVWGRSAENCDRFLSKGRPVNVKGHLQTGSYKDKDGRTVYTTEVVADSAGGVEFLGSGNGNSGSGGDRSKYGDNPSAAPGGPQAAPQQVSFDNVPPAPNVPDMPDTFQAAEDDIPF